MVLFAMTSNAANRPSSTAGASPSSPGPCVPDTPMSLDTVYLHRDSQMLEVSLSSVTPQMIARVFNVSVYLGTRLCSFWLHVLKPW